MALGVIYGIDPSYRAVTRAMNRFLTERTEGKMVVRRSELPMLPFKSNTFDKVFHTNCFPFWSNLPVSCRELYNVLKPRGKIVTAMESNHRNRTHKFAGNHLDPLQYLVSLELAGFENVHMKSVKNVGDTTCTEYQAIFAEVGEKPEREVTLRQERELGKIDFTEQVWQRFKEEHFHKGTYKLISETPSFSKRGSVVSRGNWRWK